LKQLKNSLEKTVVEKLQQEKIGVRMIHWDWEGC
jgi:hypothetical protein